jgi:anaerobic sulfite reductase subunit B
MTAMTPAWYRVVDRRVETADTVTLTLRPDRTSAGVGRWKAGQFTMVYAHGVGEVPLSISGGAGRDLRHTVRAVGAVTRAVCGAPVGSLLGVRGPFGHGWDLSTAEGADLVFVAGGIGLAPLRPLILQALDDRARYGRIAVLIGARTPADLLYTGEYAAWRGSDAQVLVTVDRADAAWKRHVGVVTTLFGLANFSPAGTVAFVCGPEVMMRFAARGLIDRGVPAEAVRVSLERNMRCGTALCGHCQLGPLLVCRDGPVVGYRTVAPLLEVSQL